MRILDIHVHRLVGGTVDGGWPAGHEPGNDLHTIVEVVGEDGLTGVGSVFTSSRLVAAGIDQLRPLWEGELAIEPERVTEKLRRSSFWQGRGGTLEHVISGIDIAAWDLFGKVCGQPISRLLGGRYRERVTPYASLLFDETGPLAERLEWVREQGFRAVKLGWRPFGRRDHRFDELLVRTARDTLGPDVDLLVDAGGSEQFWPHGYKWALRTARMLADHDVGWFEEPLPPDDLEGHVLLREHAPLPIAGGEVLTRRQSFRPWIERGALDIVQPDCTKCGGLTEARRIANMCEDHNVGFVTHGWNTAIGLAADLQLAAALPVAKYVEFLVPAPYIDSLTTTTFELDAEGQLPIPSAPGLGVELDRDALVRFGNASRHSGTP